MRPSRRSTQSSRSSLLSVCGRSWVIKLIFDGSTRYLTAHLIPLPRGKWFPKDLNWRL